MSSAQNSFYPFFDPYRNGNPMGFAPKIAISLGLGVFYLALQYAAMTDKIAYFQQYCWILGVIISTATMAVYVATATFRDSLTLIHELEGSNRVSEQVLDTWLCNRNFVFAGLVLATINTSIGHLLGVPGQYHETVFALVSMYLGFFMAGFSSGVGLLAILGVIIVFLRFAPNLQHALNPNDPDGTGGIKRLGDSLWFFSALIGLVGVLVSIYMFGVDWQYMYKGSIQALFLFWVSFPYLVAISVVLVPGLAVRRQVSYYKTYRGEQLKQEKAQLFSAFKDFEEGDDDEIIAQKKELNEKLDDVQDQMEKLHKMRNSHIDSKK